MITAAEGTQRGLPRAAAVTPFSGQALPEGGK